MFGSLISSSYYSVGSECRTDRCIWCANCCALYRFPVLDHLVVGAMVLYYLIWFSLQLVCLASRWYRCTYSRVKTGLSAKDTTL
jgi:hypothetical protein